MAIPLEIREHDLTASLTGGALRRAVFDFFLAGTSASWPDRPENALAIMGYAEAIAVGKAVIKQRDLVLPLALNDVESEKFLSTLAFCEEVDGLSREEGRSRRPTGELRRRFDYSFPRNLGGHLDDTLASNEALRRFDEEIKYIDSKLALSLTDMMTFMRFVSPEADPVALSVLGENRWLKPVILYRDGTLLIAHSLHPFDLGVFMAMSSLDDDGIVENLVALADKVDNLRAVQFQPLRRVGRSSELLPTRLAGRPAISLRTTWLEAADGNFKATLERANQVLRTHRETGVRFLCGDPAEALQEIQQWASEIRRGNRGW